MKTGVERVFAPVRNALGRAIPKEVKKTLSFRTEPASSRATWFFRPRKTPVSKRDAWGKTARRLVIDVALRTAGTVYRLATGELVPKELAKRLLKNVVKGMFRKAVGLAGATIGTALFPVGGGFVGRVVGSYFGNWLASKRTCGYSGVELLAHLSAAVVG